MNTASKELEITLIRSAIGHLKKHRETLSALGLTRIRKTVVLKGTPQVRGMVDKVSYLVNVVERD